MKLNSLFATTVIAGLVMVSTLPLPAFHANSVQAATPEIRVAQNETSQEKIDQIIALKGKPGSADLMRKFYAKDLMPIGIQRGGAGMVVNLYSKNDNTTLSLCTTYDVVVAVKKGKIVRFNPSEVK